MDDKRQFLKSFEDKLRDRLDKKSLGALEGGLEDDDLPQSKDYENFRKESISTSMNFYERLCNSFEKILNLKPDQKTGDSIEEQLKQAHINATPTGVMSLAVGIALILVIMGMLGLIIISGTIGVGFILLGVGAYFILQKLPALLAKRFRAKASDQVIMAIFYMVAYMRFNSNFELAVSFAAKYLGPPLSLDFKRLLWELDNSKYPSLKEAFDVYLDGWRDENLEFLEAIYLMESSLYESEEFRRITLLDKSLDIILQGNYEKMMHFSQELRGKVQTLNMLGVVLPILGLIILPLAASFASPKGVWEFVFITYDILFPVLVAYIGFAMIFGRPSGANSIKLPNLKNIKQLQKYKLKLSKNKEIYVSAKIPALTILGVFLFIGLIPLGIHFFGGTPTTLGECTTPLEDSINNMFGAFGDGPFSTFQNYEFIDDEGEGYCYGPYGMYPGILSLFIPLGLAFSIGYYFRIRYKNLVHLRDRTKKLEKEFPSATFQLGNRINEGISAELAFGAVSQTMKGTETGTFFSTIDSNIKFNGMSVEQAIFNEEKGAINQYPSDIVVSSMKIVTHALDRGPEITAKTLLDLSRYLSEIHSGNERMKDLLAESLSSMKSQATFLAPVISGVVISIVSLVTMIMGTLSERTAELASEAESASAASFLGSSIPTYLFQSVVGIYIVLLILILTYLVTNLEYGEDAIFTKYSMGEKVISGMNKYAVIVILGIVLFSLIGNSVLGSI